MLTREEIHASIAALVDFLRAHKVPEDTISSALAGVGIRIAMETGLDKATVYGVVDQIFTTN